MLRVSSKNYQIQEWLKPDAHMLFVEIFKTIEA